MAQSSAQIDGTNCGHWTMFEVLGMLAFRETVSNNFDLAHKTEE